MKKTDKEGTLRVYPARLYQYPLLNPRFVCQPVGGLKGRTFLEIHVWSKGDDTLDAHLRSHVPTTESKYVRSGDHVRGYFLHGRLFVRLHFRARENRLPDFDKLGRLMMELRERCTQLPNRAAYKSTADRERRLDGPER